MSTIATAPYTMQALDYSAQEDRQVVTAIGDAGVLGLGDLKVTQRAAGANMTVDVAVGRCIISGAVAHYLCHSVAVASVTIAAAPGVGNERIDVVYARIRDHEIDSGGLNEWEINVVTGTPSGSPSAPALPSANCIPLARVTLTSSTTSVTDGIITDARSQSAAPADRFWPAREYATLTAQTIENVAETWGSVVLPAPNRPVKIEATLTGDLKCATGEAFAFGEVAIRVAYGATTLVPAGLNVLAENDVTPRAVVNQYAAALIGTTNPVPGVGEAITVSARVACLSGGPAVVDHGFLLVRLFPA